MKNFLNFFFNLRFISKKNYTNQNFEKNQKYLTEIFLKNQNKILKQNVSVKILKNFYIDISNRNFNRKIKTISKKFQKSPKSNFKIVLNFFDFF